MFPFLSWLGNVNKASLKADSMAGLTGAIIVLPQGIAFAAIAGMPPIYGLYTAMITPIVAALFGSSMHLISGPTTAISLVIIGTVSKFAVPESPEYIQFVLTLTLLAGVFQLMMGLARLGTLVNFVSHSVVVGFTAGAAILIATSQLGKVFGIEIPREGDFIQKWFNIFQGLPETNFYVFGVAITTLVVALALKKFTPKIPNLLVAMIVGSTIAYFINGAENGVTLVGKLSARLPPFSTPDFARLEIEELVPYAFAIALLGLIEAVAIGKSIASKSGQRIDGNQEFIGQGLSNIVGSFFSSYAGSGSFTRSGVNYAAGAKTPMAAIFAAVILMLILLLIAPLTTYLPIAAMGGIILLVAYNLIDFKSIKQIFRSSQAEATVFSVTMLSTLFLELEFAIYMGVIISLIFYLQRTSSPNIVTLAPDKDNEHRAFVNIERKPLATCPQLKIIRIDGSLFFGAVDKVEDFLSTVYESGEKNLLIVGNGIGMVDLAGAELLEREAKKWQKAGRGFYFCSLRKQVREYLIKGGFAEHIGKENMFETKIAALQNIYSKLDKDICRECTVRIFNECEIDG
ncbi:MAG: sodium-independent anion transporter [Bacteroidetes bacterium]|nr:MAG: sodium-independent anion transporter [Bacteroidota bacterium]